MVGVGRWHLLPGNTQSGLVVGLKPNPDLARAQLFKARWGNGKKEREIGEEVDAEGEGGRRRGGSDRGKERLRKEGERGKKERRRGGGKGGRRRRGGLGIVSREEEEKEDEGRGHGRRIRDSWRRMENGRMEEGDKGRMEEEENDGGWARPGCHGAAPSGPAPARDWFFQPESGFYWAEYRVPRAAQPDAQACLIGCH